jgi:hypothetical protein
VTPETTLETLLELYAGADDVTLKRGRRWYRAARYECRKIARETGYTMRQVAAVMAITSSDAQLTNNITWTRAACANGGQTAGKYPTDQLPKIAGALADRRNPGRYATGPKVSQFYAAITGDESAIVVDRWAAYAAGHPDRSKVPGVKVRRLPRGRRARRRDRRRLPSHPLDPRA